MAGMKASNVSRGRSGPASMSRAAAEAMAIQALGFIVADDTRIERFMALSGLDLSTLREAAAAPGFFAAVLDHLSADEDLLLAFAANAGHDPGTVAAAREALSPRDETR